MGPKSKSGQTEPSAADLMRELKNKSRELKHIRTDLDAFKRVKRKKQTQDLLDLKKQVSGLLVKNSG